MFPRYVDEGGLTIVSDPVVHDHEIPEGRDAVTRAVLGLGKGALFALKRLPSLLLVCFGVVLTALALCLKIVSVLIRLPFALLGSGGNLTSALLCSAVDENLGRGG